MLPRLDIPMYIWVEVRGRGTWLLLLLLGSVAVTVSGAEAVVALSALREEVFSDPVAGALVVA